MKTINTILAPKAVGPYSQGIIINNLIFLSGQIPINPETNNIEGIDIMQQTIQVIKNIETVLEEANTNLSKVIKTTCFLKNLQDFEVFNQIYERYFVSKPARTCVEVSNLPKNSLVEIEVVAYI